jgi:hypothetical protein
MSPITIQGSITPSTYLARGVQTRVERTEFIDKLIRGGFVIVVPEPEPLAEPEPEPEAPKKSVSRRRPRAKIEDVPLPGMDDSDG